MRTAGVREARQNLSVLLDEVGKGREVVITERGRPVAKLVPPDRPRGSRPVGAFRRGFASSGPRTQRGCLIPTIETPAHC